MPRLRIEGLERDLEASADEDVRKACVKGHVNLFWSGWARVFNCRGIGLCGACPVRVVQANGGLPPRTKHEARRLANKPDDWRLACQVKVRSDLRIEPFPMVDVEERFGAEAVRRAKMEPENREDLFQKERDQRLQARRAEVKEFLATRKKRRSKLVGFFMKRLKKDEGEEAEAKKKEEKKGGLAGKLRKPGKKKEEGEQAAKKEKKPSRSKKKSKKGDEPMEQAGQKPEEGPGNKPAKKKGFKLGKGKGKKKEAPTSAGGAKGGD